MLRDRIQQRGRRRRSPPLHTRRRRYPDRSARRSERHLHPRRRAQVQSGRNPAGVPVNTFGGDFDFAHIPTGFLESVEVIRGAQSAVYGSYANSGVVNFITRQPDASPNLDIVAEGGSFESTVSPSPAAARSTALESSPSPPAWTPTAPCPTATTATRTPA